MELIGNKFWDKNRKAKITVFSPTYNRKNTLERTIRSIENQIFKDWEYIIVDDGSTDGTDELVKKYMETTDHPVLYIQKDNGGVHTARNLGFKNARGELVINIDSDDELLPEALNVYWNTWNKIPDESKPKYREIVAQCKDDWGRVGHPFPDNINELPWDEARKCCYRTGGEHVACFVTDVMKHNLFPEPEGVTFMTENILWRKLDRKYCSYYINDMLRIYHQDGNDHLSPGLNDVRHKKTIQNCKNALWESTQFLNDWEIYKDGKNYKKIMLRYCIMNHILCKDAEQNEFRKACRLQGIKNKCIFYLAWLPTGVAAKLYQKKKM